MRQAATAMPSGASARTSHPIQCSAVSKARAKVASAPQSQERPPLAQVSPGSGAHQCHTAGRRGRRSPSCCRRSRAACPTSRHSRLPTGTRKPNSGRSVPRRSSSVRGSWVARFSGAVRPLCHANEQRQPFRFRNVTGAEKEAADTGRARRQDTALGGGVTKPSFMRRRRAVARPSTWLSNRIAGGIGTPGAPRPPVAGPCRCPKCRSRS